MKPNVHTTSPRKRVVPFPRRCPRHVSLFACLAIGVVSCLLTGCGPSGSTVSQSTRGAITNQDGRVTGTIPALNITVDVRDVKTNDIGNSAETKPGPNGQSHYKRWKMTAGEVQIELERVNGGPISLVINGEDYGTISEGDELLIDEQRQVIVNGTHRESGTVVNN